MSGYNYAGLQLKNPVIVASATPSITVVTITRAAEPGAGAIVTKSVIFPDKNGRPAGGWARPRFQLCNSSNGFNPALYKKNGMFSLFRLGEPYPTPDEMARMLDTIRRGGRVTVPIVVSICGDPKDYETWRELARLMTEAGADAIELNMHAYPEHHYTDPLYVAAAKSGTKLPVQCKMMAINDSPEEYGPKIEMMGADGITALGTFGFRSIEIDIDSQRPTMETYHGMGGSWLRAVSLAYISGLAKTTHIPLSGVTGIQCADDAIKYILLGASTVQICAAIYAQGYGVIGELNAGIERYMKEKGYKSIDDFRGAALKNIKPLEYAPPVRARVNADKCVGCGQCVNLCMFDALSLKDKKAVISEKCDGCGLCQSYCPAKAIELYRY